MKGVKEIKPDTPKLHFTLLVSIFETFSWLAPGGLWHSDLLKHNELYGTILSHFDVAGQLDTYSNKSVFLADRY